MIYFTRGMYRQFDGEVTRGLYVSEGAPPPTPEPNVIHTPFIKIANPAPALASPGVQHRWINYDGTCYILYGIKASSSLIIDELILNYFKLFSVQKD